MPDETISIKYLIVHELIKETQQTEARIELSKDCLPITDRSKRLIGQLNSRYDREIIQYAKFDRDNGKLFPEEYEKYHANPSEETFLELTQRALRNLRDQIQNILLAKGGYLVFFDYLQNGSGFSASF